MEDLRMKLVDHDRQNTSKFQRALCVCSAGMLRSATLAWMLSNDPYNYNVRAAGTEDFALVPVDKVLLEWADVVFFAEQKHKNKVYQKFGLLNKVCYVMGVSDDYEFRHPELVRLFDMRLTNLGVE
jgi:predicted protein tyrosine phosphatase